VTEFGSFDNSTCNRVLDLLKPGDLTLGQVVIKRVAVVELESKQWKWRWWRLFWYRGMDGYNEADGYGNSKIWRQMRSGRKKFLDIPYSSSVSAFPIHSLTKTLLKKFPRDCAVSSSVLVNCQSLFMTWCTFSLTVLTCLIYP